MKRLFLLIVLAVCSCNRSLIVIHTSSTIEVGETTNIKGHTIKLLKVELIREKETNRYNYAYGTEVNNFRAHAMVDGYYYVLYEGKPELIGPNTAVSYHLPFSEPFKQGYFQIYRGDVGMYKEQH